MDSPILHMVNRQNSPECLTKKPEQCTTLMMSKPHQLSTITHAFPCKYGARLSALLLSHAHNLVVPASSQCSILTLKRATPNQSCLCFVVGALGTQCRVSARPRPIGTLPAKSRYVSERTTRNSRLEPCRHNRAWASNNVKHTEPQTLHNHAPSNL